MDTLVRPKVVVANEADMRWLQVATHSAVQISGFFGPYRFLSNFWPAWVVYDGLVYPTVENAYQAAKFARADRQKFLTCSPGEAKALSGGGSRLYSREAWAPMKVAVMHELVGKKVSVHHPDLRRALLETGIAELKETNWWGDTFWGVYLEKKTDVPVGENNLGKLLMEVRSGI